MKKVLLGFLVVLTFGVLSFVAVRAHGFDDFDEPYTTDERTPYGYMGGRGCHGRYGRYVEGPTYEMIYNHLYEDDQIEMDLLLAERISNVDMSQMTEEEKTDTIRQIKEELVDVMYDNYDYIGDYYGE